LTKIIPVLDSNPISHSLIWCLEERGWAK